MKVLVTGGAGFIGSHIAEAYQERGDHVVVLDNLSTGKRSNVPAGVELIELDIRAIEAAALIRERKFDLVSHHAAQIDVRSSVTDPRNDASVNVDGLLNLLEACKDSGVRRFMYVSSGGVVYGTPEIRPTPESAPKVPESPYGVSKLTGEHYLYYYCKIFGMDYVAVRYSNVYGPRQDPHGEAGVVAIFSTRLLRGEPLTIYGDGDQTRDYVYVGDVAAANLLLGEAEMPEPTSIDSRAFNVGCGVETSVNGLAAILAGVADTDLVTSAAPPRPGELRYSSLDSSKLRTKGWAPRMTIDEGLKRTYDWIAVQESRKALVAG